jgi:hypothetical protein
MSWQPISHGGKFYVQKDSDLYSNSRGIPIRFQSIAGAKQAANKLNEIEKSGDILKTREGKSSYKEPEWEASNPVPVGTLAIDNDHVCVCVGEATNRLSLEEFAWRSLWLGLGRLDRYAGTRNRVQELKRRAKRNELWRPPYYEKSEWAGIIRTQYANYLQTGKL